MNGENTRQSLPSKEYTTLLGIALYVFNSNNSFIIESILNNDSENKYSWYKLTDRTSGRLDIPINNIITTKDNHDISNLFKKLVNKRNRIIHSFPITGSDGQQLLATKDKRDVQFVITEQYLLEFITENEELNLLLHDLRKY